MNGLVEVIDRYGNIDNLPKKETLKSDLSREEQEKLLEKLAAARDGRVTEVGTFKNREQLLKECAEEAEGTSISPSAMNKKKRKKAEDESGRYLIALTELARSIDDDVIADAKGFDDFQKMYLFYLKYGDSLFVDGTMKKGVFYYNDVCLISMLNPDMFRIETASFNEEDSTVTFEGRSMLDCMSLLIGVNASTGAIGTYTNDNKKAPDRHDKVVRFTRFRGGDVRGFASEPFIEGQKFSVTVDLREGTEIRFLAEQVNSSRISLRVRMGRYAGFGDDSLHGYRVMGSFIVQQHVNYLTVKKVTPELIQEAEDEYVKSMVKKNGDAWLEERKKENELKELAETGDILDRTVFVTTRGSSLDGGIKRLYDLIDGEKEIFAETEPWTDETVMKAVDLIFHSRTVIMDSQVPVLKTYSKREGQRFIQLWHGVSAYRKICGDEPDVLPCLDALYHRDYDMLTVSSYRMKDIYSEAMRVDPSRIAVTGSPDSDECFDSEKIEADKKKVLEKHPEFAGKQVILYIPAAAERKSTKNAAGSYFGTDAWDSAEGIVAETIDYGSLSKALLDDQIFAVCPDTDFASGAGKGTLYPREDVLTKGIGARFLPRKKYDNVVSAADVSPEEAIAASSIVISDYSPAVYTAVLENKPVSFYCPDGGRQSSVTYIDYATELPGEMFEDQYELENYLSIGKYAVSVTQNDFRRKFLGKSDGSACRRTAEILNSGEPLDFTGDVDPDADITAETSEKEK